jgi:3-hydroxybutyryl-CoA dehydrogenase
MDSTVDTPLGEVRRVGVVGAGTMGAGIAQVFALKGFSAAVVDTNGDALVRARVGIDSSLTRMVRKATITEADRSAALARLTFDREMAAAASADFIVEAVVEDEEVKRTLFRELSATVRPGVVLASNTSSISITRLAAAAQRPELVIGMHFMNPVPIMELVEVIRGHATSDATHAATVNLARRLGKSPVTVSDYPGFIANRILLPMINEAIFALMEGVASKEDIDQVFRLGMHHPMGPLALADFIGLDVCLSILEVLHEGLGDPKYRPCPLLRRMVDAGHVGRKRGRGFYEYQE